MTEQQKELLEAAKEVLLKLGVASKPWERLRKAIEEAEKNG